MSSSNPNGPDALSTTVAPQCCTGCKQSDANQKIIPCSKCGANWHLKCAGLPDDFEGSWRCNHCSTFYASHDGSVSSVKSTVSAQLRLKQLQESKALEDKIEQEKAERERRYLAEKHSLEAEAEAERTGGASIRSSASRMRNRQRDINAWVEAAKDAKNGQQRTDNFEQPPPGVHTSTPVNGTGVVPKDPPLGTAVDAQQQQVVQTSQQNPLNVFNTPLGLPKHMLPPTKPSGTQGQSLPAIQPANQKQNEPAVQNLGRPTMQRSVLAEDMSIPAWLGPLGVASQSVGPIPPQPTALPAWHNSGLNFQPSLRAQQSGAVNGLLPQLSQANAIPQLQQHGIAAMPQHRYIPQASRPGLIPVSASQGFPNPPPLHQSESLPWNQQVSMHPFMPQQAPGIPPAMANGVITAQQLAARQVVSKELPKFSGDPLEWPMFLSAFESTTLICGIQPDENLLRLQKSLVGKAREMVQSILTLPTAIPEIIATLRDECGRPEQLVHCLLSKVRNAPSPNVNKLETLVTFGREVRNLVTYIEAANLQLHLSNPMLLSELVAKLPPSIRLDWGLHTQRLQNVTLRAFSDYVSSLKTAACHVSLPTDTSQPDDRRAKKKEKSGFVNAHSSDHEPKGNAVKEKRTAEARPCLGCQRTDHKIRNCEKFKNFSLADRWSFAEKNELCQRCLVAHGKWPCRTKQPCGIDGCNGLHHKLLHPGKDKANSNNAGASAVVTAHHLKQASTLFKILPVTLFGKGKSMKVFAFLDDGSNKTLLENGVANELGLDGELQPLVLEWTSNVTRREATSRRVELDIAGIGSDKKHHLSDVCTVGELGLPRQSLDYKQLAKQFPHLQGLPVNSYQGAKPQILIGLADARLKLPLKTRERRDGEPVASKTRLGWTIFGGRRSTADRARVMVHDICDVDEADQTLHDIVKEYLENESFGIAGACPPESPEDQRARKILHDTTIRTETGRFETGLLWKSDDIEFPESFKMADRRMKCLERRMEKESGLKEIVDNQILEYLQLGYAHVATDVELQNADPRRVWYLPLGIVRNPRKPGKVRVVWDAAARVGNVSLNSQLLKGPDLLVPLPSVMCRFRQRQYAVAGDVKQMFHQLQIRKEDRQSQRFLYRTDPNAPPTTYVMDVATFGAACSPCSAQYVKNLNAMEYQEMFPDAAKAIIENTYVDDFLDSRDTVEEAAQLVLDVREVFSKACFEIRNWQSNSGDVLRRVGGGSAESTKKFIAEKSTVAERILGITWMPEADVLTFNFQLRSDLQHLVSGEVVPTKRDVLRVVMSVFDPLGFIATYTIHGKALIQDIWRSRVGWDDKIVSKDFDNWKRWIELSSELAKVRIPRCYFPNYTPESLESIELVIFTDASEIAYCCVAYFRIVDQGAVRCSLVSAKSKVIPLKPQSIPRNELNAAVMGVRMANTIMENHTLPIAKRSFFTDSKCVTSWLRADPRKYRQYVSFRVAEILDSSQPSEWEWISTTINVADKGTKWGKSGPRLDPDCEWFTAPKFIFQPRSEWSTKNPDLAETDEELRAVFAYHGGIPSPLIDFEHFSSFQGLLKRIAMLYHFAHRCRYRGPRNKSSSRIAVLSQKDYAAAEKALWRMVQMEYFPDEVSTLQMNIDRPADDQRKLEKSSELFKLSPYLDDDGIVRMESRIDTEAAYFAYDFRNPIIIPKDHHVTSLLINRVHQRYGHANTETVVNELRLRYYIPKLRSTVKKVVKRCQWCRIYRARPSAPRMAPLPQPRVTPYVRPFTFVGLDYFGPLIVKRGRTNVKRWVALFTCLTVRALHLEVVHTLSAESCKMAIRRFVARRGAPQQIYSDNGTNFRGAAKELADEIKAINREIAGTFTNADTEWLFNPPAAPHMGGVWERKVRSVKEGFKVLAHRQRLDDEGFVTLLAEVEMIVNSHPLTFVPLESPGQPVLTPNNFLMMSSSGVNAEPRLAEQELTGLNTNWKLMLNLTDQFWKQWIKSYLPTIARRTKWFADVRPLQEGDLVIIVDESVRNGWQRGRVLRAHLAPDGQVRKVDVETDSGVVRRPAIKVALLEVLEGGKATQTGGITGRGVPVSGTPTVQRPILQ